MRRQPEKGQNRRRDVNVLGRPLICFARQTRRVNDQRYSHKLRERQVGMRGEAMLEEGLAMIAGEHDDGAVPESVRVEIVDESSDLSVQIRKTVVVHVENCSGGVRRELAKSDWERNSATAEARRKITGALIRNMAALQIHVHEERIR